jgi:hypothetical protein
MKTKNIALRVASVLFMLVALGHLVRLVLGWTLVVGGWTIGPWPSVVVVAGATALSVWMWMASICEEADSPASPPPKP